jgi:hypothetical protein
MLVANQSCNPPRKVRVEVGYHLACDEDVLKTVRAVSLQGLNPATPSKKYDLKP